MSPGTNDHRRGSGKDVVVAATLILAATLFYAHSVRFGFLYDDVVLIVEQERPQSLGDVLAVFGERHWHNLPYYRPVARLTMVLQKAWHGDDAGPFHLFNGALAGCVAALVFALLRLPRFGASRRAAALAATLVAVHPVASSCVYPICSGRETAIPAVWVLATLWAFLRGGRAGQPLALLFCALALLSKEQAVVLPGMLVAADLLRVTPDPPGRSPGRWIARHLPFVLLTAGYLVVRTRLFGGIAEGHGLEVLRHPSGPFLSVLHTLQTIVLPTWDLAYEPRVEVWLSWPRAAVAGAVAVGLALGLARSGGEGRRVGLFLATVFVLALLPTANVLRQEAPFAERYVLLPLVASVLAGAYVAPRLAAPGRPGQSVRPGRWWGRASSAACVAVVLLLGATSFHRGDAFESEFAFLERWRASDPAAAQPYASLGDYHVRRGEVAEGIEHFRVALERTPRSVIVLNNLGTALRTLGLERLAAGDRREARRLLDESLVHYAKAVRVDPGYFEAVAHLGAALFQDGLSTGHAPTIEEALRQLERALELRPSDAQVAGQAGAALLHLGLEGGDPARLVAAEAHLRVAVREGPLLVEPHHNLALLLGLRGRGREAVLLLADLGERLAGRGRRAEAEAALRGALEQAEREGLRERAAELRARLDELGATAGRGRGRAPGARRGS